MRTKLFFIGIIIVFFSISAQATILDSIKKLYMPRNIVYGEFLGNSMMPFDGGGYSVNYERIGLRIKNFYWGARIGFAYVQTYIGGNNPMCYRIYANWLVNVQYQFHKCFAVEYGSGFIKIFDSEHTNNECFNMMIGLRFIIRRGLFVRLSLVPLKYRPRLYDTPEFNSPPVGLALGWSFGKWKCKHPERQKWIQY